MRRHNCPNCGAPIESTQCPYCGTVFYDFTAMDTDKPTYIRMNWYAQQIVFKALMRSAQITQSCDELPSAVIDFSIMEDDEGVLVKQIELQKGE